VEAASAGREDTSAILESAERQELVVGTVGKTNHWDTLSSVLKLNLRVDDGRGLKR